MRLNGSVEVTTEEIRCKSCGDLNTSLSCNHATTEEIATAMLLLEQRWRRPKKPLQHLLATMDSLNHNGTYSISLLQDGTIACTCLSFLFNRGLVERVLPTEATAAVCKHICTYLEHPHNLPDREDHPLKFPTPWQKAFLGQLGVTAHPRLSAEQAYFVIEGLLSKQGVSYLELEDLVKHQGSFSVLPIYPFGIEFEGFNIQASSLAEALRQAGLLTEVQGYNHQTQSVFKIVQDASIQGVNPFELVTPKLFGAEGFQKLSTLCEVVNRLGGRVNRSCGLHVHIDAWNFELSDIKRLIKVIRKIEEPVFFYLLPASRRNSRYCRALTDELVNQVGRMRSINSLSQIQDRYFSFNLNAWSRYRTFEFRNHSGTFSNMKVISWVVFLLMLMDSVKRGLTADDIEPTWPGVSQAIGLTDGTSLINRSHGYLTGRNDHWRNNRVPTEESE